MYKSLLLVSCLSVCFVQLESAETPCKPIKENAQDENSQRLLKQALSYLHEQEQDKAVQTFLDSISGLILNPTLSMEAGEKSYYDQGLELYLNENPSISPKETAYKLVDLLEPIAMQHPQYHSVKLLLCTAYANEGRFDKFFQLFFEVYPHTSNHYLSHKILAILHVKLFEKGKTPSDREYHRQQALVHTKEAINLFPKDITLYKIAIILSNRDEKKQVVNDCLIKIINNNIIIPRHEIAFFVQEAIDSFQLDLAQKFVDKCREWYQYSRVINEIQELISRKKKYE